MTTKRDDLYLLSLFHYGYAAVTGLFSLLPLLYVGMGIFMLRGGFDDTKGGSPPHAFGWLMVIVGLGLAFAFLAYAIGLGFAGYFLSQNRRRTFILVMDAISCIFFPYGTMLGVISFIVLSKPDVKAVFEEPALFPPM